LNLFTPNEAAATPTLPRLGPRWVATRTHRAPEEWLNRVETGGHGFHPFEAIDDRAQFEEKLMMGLRLSEGVAMSDLNPAWLNAQKIAALQREGLLDARADRLVPTYAGRMVLTSLNAALLA
jgi:oxygen-independent coproporphyrinogen-3 oxidase